MTDLTARIAVAIHGATPPNPDAALALHRAQAERVAAALGEGRGALRETLVDRLEQHHWDGRGCGTNGSGGCVYCFGPSPASAGEIVDIFIAALTAEPTP